MAFSAPGPSPGMPSSASSVGIGSPPVQDGRGVHATSPLPIEGALRKPAQQRPQRRVLVPVQSPPTRGRENRQSISSRPRRRLDARTEQIDLFSGDAKIFA